jgi:diguanylate cyclase (GGDEF)-like protein/PAS domain S-box-containing protein
MFRSSRPRTPLLTAAAWQRVLEFSAVAAGGMLAAVSAGGWIGSTALAPALGIEATVIHTGALLCILTGGLVSATGLLAIHSRWRGRQRMDQSLTGSMVRGAELLPVASYDRSTGERPIFYRISAELESMLGYSQADWLSDARLWTKLLHTDDRERVAAERAHHLEVGQHFVSEYRLRSRDGRVVWVRDQAIILREDESGKMVQRGVLIDITERKQVEEALEHQALHDSLTDLPNRTLLYDRLQQAIIQARRDGKPLALLLMDLDRFKEVNDTFGHQYGDLLLRQVVAHLRYVLRESDTVARLGGDEFAVILPGDDMRGASLTVEKLLHVLRQPYSADDHVLDIGASIGIAIYPDHGHDAHALLQRADVAMYVAKRRDCGYAIYEPTHDPYTPSRLTLVRELRDAIDHDELVLHYQPKAHFRSGGSNHVEALLRWHHPDHGWIQPAEFISLAEHAGLMKPLSVWVLNTALRQSHVWREAGMDVSVAVNLSARTLHDPDLVATIQGLLEKWQIAPGRLELEITEGALMDDPSGAMDTLTRLHGMGVLISIDDFGTGYSSLSYLTRLPADQIKIDKSFVLDMIRNHDSAFIVRSVIDLGHNLSLRVVAEGVENQETWDLLDSMGCDVAQGYHLSRPLPAAEIGRWLIEPRQPVPCAS